MVLCVSCHRCATVSNAREPLRSQAEELIEADDARRLLAEAEEERQPASTRVCGARADPSTSSHCPLAAQYSGGGESPGKSGIGDRSTAATKLVLVEGASRSERDVPCTFKFRKCVEQYHRPPGPEMPPVPHFAHTGYRR